MFCPLHTIRRAELVSRAGPEEIERILLTPERAQATARWFIQQGILQQFNLVKEIEEEEAEDQTPFQPLEAEQDFP